ncbi:hypothetical protein DVH05_001800 [Phytophthora capsici]|nr:hypothetical protein DVH05_001800 [Phytophthora capsici]
MFWSCVTYSKFALQSNEQNLPAVLLNDDIDLKKSRSQFTQYVCRCRQWSSLYPSASTVRMRIRCSLGCAVDVVAGTDDARLLGMEMLGLNLGSQTVGTTTHSGSRLPGHDLACISVGCRSLLKTSRSIRHAKFGR